MNPYVGKKIFTSIVCAIFLCSATAQTQEDFMTKLSDVYVNAADKKKALEIAKELYKSVEEYKDLQTYSNYLMLTQVFENQAPEADLAKICKEKADKLLAAMVGGASSTGGVAGNDPNSQWLNEYYTPLFSTTDPQNAAKASAFLSKNPSLQTYSNYTYIAYAFERNGDFQKAKENYEKALTKKGNEKEEFHSYSYYANFLARSGEYLKAEEYIKKMETLSEEASDLFKTSYKSESLVSKVVYYLTVGDYASYLQAANEQYDYFGKMMNTADFCDSYTMSRYTISAHAKEMLKDYPVAALLWQKRDSSHYAWIECNNTKYPNNKQYQLSILPVYQMKTGKKSAMNKPVSFYIQETETHYNSYAQYQDMQIKFMKAVQLGFLGASQYHNVFNGVIDQIINTKNFSESTLPLSYYAYFTMRDYQLEKAAETYNQLFRLNIDWINDVIFSFGEKAFVTYYNAKLRDGYENYHSFVKIAKEKNSALFPKLASQAYNNLLFTKSLSLKGTQKRKQAFRKANDPAILQLYDEWIDKKQQLIRLYRKAEDASSPAEKNVDQDQLKKLQEEVNHLENELATKAKDFKKYLKLVPPDWRAIRSQLNDDEAAVEMIRFQWRNQVYYSDTTYYAAYIITKNSQHPDIVYLKTSATDLENKFYKLYQNSIKFKLKDNTSYPQYWKPVMDQLKGIKKIYFSPDGIYHLINLPTLLNPETGKFILDEIDIHYTTSSIDVQQQPIQENVGSAVLFGRPSYEVKSNEKTLPQLPHETRSFVANFKENTISDLPGTEEEVLTIKKEMNAHSIKVNLYLRDQATEEKMYHIHSPDIIHIATHGYWSEAGNTATEGYRMFNAMVNSGLLMSGVVNYYRTEEFPDTYDGILTAYEAQNLDLENTSLVVLSACETSLGHMDAGEGIYGLQRAFREAGAKSIMTSLWKVDDAATKEFMILFYQHYLQTKNKFEAFRVAQKKLKEKYPEPYFWGAFILTGY